MWPQNRSTTFDLFTHLRRYTIKIKRNLKHFLLFLRNAQAIHEMPRGKYFCQCTYCLQNLSITCIASSFSPLHEMPDIFMHFMKCFTSRIACTIYIYLKEVSIIFFGAFLWNKLHRTVGSCHSPSSLKPNYVYVLK